MPSLVSVIPTEFLDIFEYFRTVLHGSLSHLYRLQTTLENILSSPSGRILEILAMCSSLQAEAVQEIEYVLVLSFTEY